MNVQRVGKQYLQSLSQLGQAPPTSHSNCKCRIGSDRELVNGCATAFRVLMETLNNLPSVGFFFSPQFPQLIDFFPRMHRDFFLIEDNFSELSLYTHNTSSTHDCHQNWRLLFHLNRGWKLHEAVSHPWQVKCKWCCAVIQETTLGLSGSCCSDFPDEYSNRGKLGPSHSRP